MTDFNRRWYKVLTEIWVRPDDDSLVEMLMLQLKKSSVLTDDMNKIENLAVNHPDRTYAWLMSIMQTYIHKHKENHLHR